MGRIFERVLTHTIKKKTYITLKNFGRVTIGYNIHHFTSITLSICTSSIHLFSYLPIFCLLDTNVRFESLKIYLKVFLCKIVPFFFDEIVLLSDRTIATLHRFASYTLSSFST